MHECMNLLMELEEAVWKEDIVSSLPTEWENGEIVSKYKQKLGDRLFEIWELSENKAV